jgi:DNA-binding NarL/FixJ family response regulator
LLRREPDFEVVTQAGSLTQALQMLDTPLDVAVVDLALPDGDGRELIGELRRRNAGISVVVLSAIIEPRHLEAVLKARADVVLHKIASIPTIVEEVRRLAGRDEPPQEHDDHGCRLPRIAYYSRRSEDAPSSPVGMYEKRFFYFQRTMVRWRANSELFARSSPLRHRSRVLR